MTTNPAYVPADQAFAADPAVNRRYSVRVDASENRGTWHMPLLSFSEGAGFARSEVGGLVYRIVRTGRMVARNGMVRVAIFAAEDEGRADGALSFPNRTMGGYVNVDLLAR